MRFTPTEVNEALSSLRALSDSLGQLDRELEQADLPGEVGSREEIEGRRRRAELCSKGLDLFNRTLEEHASLILTVDSVHEFRQWLDQTEKFLKGPYTYQWDEKGAAFDEIYQARSHVLALIRRLEPRVPAGPPAVFLVHGPNALQRDGVRDLLTSHGYNVIVLVEEPGRGRTIMEKFAEHASQAHHAVVLLAKDDRGGPASANASEYQPRARQNVVYELGYFHGVLGAERVCVLREDGVEIPSDCAGLDVIPMDSNWKKRLLEELAEK